MLWDVYIQPINERPCIISTVKGFKSKQEAIEYINLPEEIGVSSENIGKGIKPHHLLGYPVDYRYV